jgi:methylated-DNA-protein-cysteine methyltransferase-like protein
MTRQQNTGFFERVYAVLARIPSGKVISYGQIAVYLGAPRSARMVGWALSACPEDLPWQRVVYADGSIGGGSWADLRRQLLVDEGVVFLPDGRVDMARHAWKG